MDTKDTQENTGTSNGHSFGQDSTNAFYHKHLSVSVIAKKTEKITTAIYMVTDFISESEPLRPELRSLAIALVSGTRKIGARSTDPHYALREEVTRTIDEIVVFVSLASTIGLVSEMNGKIITAELEKVKADIEHHYGNTQVLFATHPGYANILLTPKMFEVESSEKLLENFNKGQLNHKGHESAPNAQIETPAPAAQKNESFSRKIDIGTKIARRNDVLNVVRNKGRVSIKDITSILKDTSEKTVQRELLGLVKEGVLVKEGEKRWSMYRIAS